MAAFLVGTPLSVAAAPKVVAKRSTTVVAAAQPEKVNRRAAVAGVAALFGALSVTGAANATQVRAPKKVKKEDSPYEGLSTGGLGKFKKGLRPSVASQTAAASEYYGVGTLPGQ